MELRVLSLFLLSSLILADDLIEVNSTTERAEQTTGKKMSYTTALSQYRLSSSILEFHVFIISWALDKSQLKCSSALGSELGLFVSQR